MVCTRKGATGSSYDPFVLWWNLALQISSILCLKALQQVTNLMGKIIPFSWPKTYLAFQKPLGSAIISFYVRYLRKLNFKSLSGSPIISSSMLWCTLVAFAKSPCMCKKLFI